MSNKKTLLNEGTIRRFMKLANMGNLAENYLENYDLEEGKEEEEVEEGMRLGKEDDEVEEGMYAAKQDDDEPAMRDLDEEEEMELDMDAEMDEPMDTPEDEGGAPDEAMVKKLVDAIAVAIEGATGVEVAVEGGDDEPDMDDMGGMDDMDGEAEEDADELEMGDEEPAMRDGVMEDDQFDAYIAEVTKRVAKRIIKSKLSK
jgi:hypothetical protein